MSSTHVYTQYNDAISEGPPSYCIFVRCFFLSSKRRITFGISLVRDFFTVDLFILHCVVVCCDWLFLYTLIVSTVVIALLPVMMCPSVVFPTQSV